jgi:hypothetical protein
MLGSFSLNSAKAQDKTSSKIAYYNRPKSIFLSGGNKDDNDKGITCRPSMELMYPRS